MRGASVGQQLRVWRHLLLFAAIGAPAVSLSATVTALAAVSPTSAAGATSTAAQSVAAAAASEPLHWGRQQL